MTQRLALVTGGITGIGAAISKALKAAGYRVVANYVHDDAAAKKFEEETGIKTYRWDVSDFGECAKAVDKICADSGSTIEVLINNAGITRDGMLHKMTPENWSAVLVTNLFSCFNMCRAVINPMREKGFGRIISISSVNGQMGQLGQTNYCASKAGIIGFSKALAKESASKGITVNTLAPGYTDTPMVKGVPENIMKTIISQIPVGRLAEPGEIARAALFLASDDAGCITGETISVNGGMRME